MSRRRSDFALRELADRLRDEGGLLAAVVRDDGAEVAAARVADRFAVAVAAIEEGYRLHYDRPRLLDVAGDADAALLVGDHLYALGLAELAEIGDLAAVRAMAQVIDRSAVAQAAGDGAAASRAWAIGTRALGDDR